VMAFTAAKITTESGEFLPVAIPDTKSKVNQVASSCRVSREMKIDPKHPGVCKFVEYAKAWIDTHVSRASITDIKSFDDWIDSSNMTGARRSYLRELYAETTGINFRDLTCQSFIKFEDYYSADKGCGVYKTPRAINSLSDKFKCLMGPICNALDKALYTGEKTKKYFVKGSNPKTWGSRLRELFGNRPVYGTDFTSFEAHHQGPYAEVVAYWMKHTLQPVHDKFSAMLLDEAVLGVNECNYAKFIMWILQCLMSGSFWTSSSNGLLNLLKLSYASSIALLVGEDAHLRLGEVSALDTMQIVRKTDETFTGLCEGDDGIFLFGPFALLLLVAMGVLLKLDYYDNYSQASFCGIICSEESDVIVADPRKIIRRFQWISYQYLGRRKGFLLGLYRAKALSLYTLYRNAPVVGEFLHAVLRHTRTCNVTDAMIDSLGHYRKDFFDADAWKEPPLVSIQDRLLVEKLWGVTEAQQDLIETACKRTTSLDMALPIDDWLTDWDIRHNYNYQARGEFSLLGTQKTHQMIESLIAPDGSARAAKNPLVCQVHKSKVQFSVPGSYMDCV